MISFFWECTVALRIDNQKNLYSNDFSKQQRVEEQYGPSTLHRTSPAPLTKGDATSGFATMSVKLDMLPSYVLLFLLAAAPPLMVSARPPRFPISSYSKRPCLTFSALSTRVLHTSIFEHRLQTKSVSMVSLTKFSHIRLRRCGRSINGLTSYLSQSCSAPHPSPAQVLGTRAKVWVHLRQQNLLAEANADSLYRPIFIKWSASLRPCKPLQPAPWCFERHPISHRN